MLPEQAVPRRLQVPGEIPVYGYIYDCKTGKLVEVPEATAAGKAV